ncbi:MAG: flavodoxin family protein [Candidatus Abyssobacteria bacterium SURF_17]|uniref:Flavodoxin family protein n=1 Tax=Candidatus Abyssobacteria bacterium SURF_17 TaxID=2093361 RepID=A0A419F6V2_9BACT|nr:MAG: flavodoxin family protein [Candidatus Abyssubacteria bacterium SURF_17]
MKVIGLNGSPRKNANTSTLVEAVLKGAAAKGAETRIVNLNELKMQGCQGCEACKKKPGECVRKDDLSPLLQEIGECDAIVLGTPIYWFHVSAQTKTLIDRFYCFLGEEKNSETGETNSYFVFPSGKKFVIVTSQGDENPELYQPALDWLNLVATIMGAASTEFITHCGSANDKASARNNAELMAKAESVGASLV